MDIFGTLPLTPKGKDYTVTIQDMLIKYLENIAMADYTVHEWTGFAPFQLRFGRKVNLASMLATTPSLKYEELFCLQKTWHEKYLPQAK